MIDVLALKYNCLNAIIFSEIEFFQDLLRAAMEKELISLKEGVDIREAMFTEVSAGCEKWIEDNEYDCNINLYREIYTENHMNLISVYLFNCSKPSEVLEMLMKTSAEKIHENAIRYHEKKVNNIYLKLCRHEYAIKRVSNMANYYNDLKKAIIDVYNVAGKAELLSDTVWYAEYIPMNFSDLNYKNIVLYYEKYVDAFILETKILSKFGEQIKKMFRGKSNDDLTDVLLEFVYMLLRMKVPKLLESAKNCDKRKAILSQCQEYVYHLLFNCEDIIQFSEDEKTYLRKYLFRRLEKDSFKDYM